MKTTWLISAFILMCLMLDCSAQATERRELSPHVGNRANYSIPHDLSSSNVSDKQIEIKEVQAEVQSRSGKKLCELWITGKFMHDPANGSWTAKSCIAAQVVVNKQFNISCGEIESGVCLRESNSGVSSVYMTGEITYNKNGLFGSSSKKTVYKLTLSGDPTGNISSHLDTWDVKKVK